MPIGTLINALYVAYVAMKQMIKITHVTVKLKIGVQQQ